MATMMPSGMTQPKKRSRRNVDSIRPVNSTLCFSSSVMSGASSTPGMRVTVKMRTSASEPSHWRRRSPAPLGAVRPGPVRPGPGPGGIGPGDPQEAGGAVAAGEPEGVIVLGREPMGGCRNAVVLAGVVGVVQHPVHPVARVGARAGERHEVDVARSQ